MSIPTTTEASISRIPPEILSKIFVHYPPVDPISHPTRPLLLGSVCRLWRTLVLATPALWASLDIICHADVLRPALPIINSHLQHSGTHPFSFDLNAAGLEDFDSVNPHIRTVLMALTTVRQRWHDVHIKTAWMTQDTLDLITLGDAPLLRSIKCDVLGFPERGVPIPLYMLHSCPRLELFHWKSSGSRLTQHLESTQLTSLSLQGTASVSECITLLRLSPRLSSAWFYDINSSGPSTASHLTHPVLCTLTATGARFHEFLAALTLPTLLDLYLLTVTILPDTAWDTVGSFLMRTPTLRKLSLATDHMRHLEPALPRILALAPRLRSLKLSDCSMGRSPFTSAIIRALHPLLSPDTPLCPCLQRLHISGISNCPDGLCGAMLRARRGARAHANGVARLERGSIGFNGGVHDHDQADMEELCAEGMEGIIHMRD